jgi:hypothetical protein
MRWGKSGWFAFWLIVTMAAIVVLGIYVASRLPEIID